MIGGSAVGTFGASMWLPLPPIEAVPSYQSPIELVTAPMQVINGETLVEFEDPPLVTIQ